MHLEQNTQPTSQVYLDHILTLSLTNLYWHNLSYSQSYNVRKVLTQEKAFLLQRTPASGKLPKDMLKHTSVAAKAGKLAMILPGFKLCISNAVCSKACSMGFVFLSSVLARQSFRTPADLLQAYHIACLGVKYGNHMNQGLK